MLRTASLALARRHLASSASAPARIADLVALRAVEGADHLALVVPETDVRWTYGELVDRARCFASGLSEMGYAPGQRLGARLDNSEHLLVALLGAALTGADVETAKTAELLAAVRCRGTIVRHEDAAVAGAMVGQHEPIAVGGGAITDPIVHYDILIEAFRGKEPPPLPEDGARSSYYFSTERAATEEVLLAHAVASVEALDMRRGVDKLCISVPLAHAMGFGFGALAAMRAGATVVLPSLAGGPERAAESTARAMIDEKCALMLADSHTLKALPGGLDTPPEGMEAFRGGLTKVGSGDAVGLGEPRMWAGVPFHTVGKPPAP